MQWRFFVTGLCLCTHLFASAINRVDKSLAFKTGYRWDTITSSGALTNASIINNGVILLSPVSGNPVTRKLNNINVWQVGAEASALLERCFFIGIELSHGHLFSQPREILSGTVATSDAAFSKTFNHSIVPFNDKHSLSVASFHLGPQVRLKGPVYITPYFGFTYERLAFSEDNSIRTHLPNFGASIRFFLNPRFQVSAFCHYNFKGRRKEKITLQIHNGIAFYLPAELLSGSVHGPAARLKIDWLFSKRWRLGFAYTYRNFRTTNATNRGFGGACNFKTTWRAESIDTSIRYSF